MEIEDNQMYKEYLRTVEDKYKEKKINIESPQIISKGAKDDRVRTGIMPMVGNHAGSRNQIANYSTTLNFNKNQKK